MTLQQIALLAVLLAIGLFCLIAGGWDCYVLWILKRPDLTWCNAFRVLNRDSNGLLGAVWICGWVALTWHLLFLCWMPRDWKP